MEKVRVTRWVKARKVLAQRGHDFGPGRVYDEIVSWDSPKLFANPANAGNIGLWSNGEIYAESSSQVMQVVVQNSFRKAEKFHTFSISFNFFSWNVVLNDNNAIHFTRPRYASVAISPLALRWMRGSPRTECAWRTTPIYMWREQAIIEWSRRVNSIVACCHGAKLCAHAARISDRNTRCLRHY